MNETVKKAATAKVETSPVVSLKSLMTPSKTVEFDYPGCDGFKVKLCYLAREELVKLRGRCVSQVFNRKTRGYEEQLDDEKFLTEYTKSVIKGWSGLTLLHLKNLVLIEDVEDESQELPFSQENVETLMKNSSDFDTWVTEQVGELENFTQSK
tara:strand:- start:1203 stop:1661 length:459 start_codon:yes stop_codon:yes gene_type:complete